MMSLLALLRPHALVVLLGAGAALALWAWQRAQRQLAVAEEALRLERDQRWTERDIHQAELDRLEAHHLAELDRQRRLAYGLAAQRERETLAEPPTDQGAAESAARRADYRTRLGEGTHDR
jgi:hypothetical protein